ncbi:MAG: DUF2284 domain-containing protein [Ruminococcaceae bacterium]|nr:DUF2284 domain-containing protein [Oscillospiraceae bacterium]
MMDIESICTDIVKLGASRAEYINTSEIVFNTDFRKSCEENKCGNYGKNYTCPPYAGTAQQLIEKVKSYSKAAVIVCTEKISGYDDVQGMQLANDRIAHIAQLADEYAQQKELDYMIIGGSNCKKCSPCRMVLGEKCPQPQKAFISLSAFCIDIAKLSESCNIQMVWDGSEISYFAMLLIR